MQADEFANRDKLKIFPDKNSLFPHIQFSTNFFLMKMTSFKKIVSVSFILDIDDIQLWLRYFSLILHAYKAMTVFLIFSVQNLKKIVITFKLQIQAKIS